MRAIVLAGGKGSRLAPWHTAKCLMPICGVSMIVRLLRHLVSETQEKIVCVGNFADHVRNALAGPIQGVSGSVGDHFFPLFSDVGPAAAMGSRLLAARDSLLGAERERHIVCYGDELADVDIDALLKLHESKGAALPFTAARQVVPGGVVPAEDEDCRVEIIDNESHWVNIGFAVVEPQCWSLLKPEDGLSDWINRVAQTMNVRVHYHEGRRATVNSLADLEEAERVWR